MRASAAITVRPGRLPIHGVWALFEHRGATRGYWTGELLQQFDTFDQTLGGTVASEVAARLDAMHNLGINAISLQ